jgi:hypothetical protein
VEIGASTAGPGAGEETTTGTGELVCGGDICPSSGGLGVYRNIAITRPRTRTLKIVITLPRSEVHSFNFSIFAVHSTRARH